MKQDQSSQRIRRGYLIMAGLLLAAALVFNLDLVADQFRSYTRVVALVEETNGIRVGSTVLVAGVEAGRVTGITFVERDGRILIATDLRLEESATSLVREGSRAFTARRQFIGEPTVRIEPAPREAPPVERGDTLLPSERPSVGELVRSGEAFPPALDSLAVTLTELQALVGTRRPELETLIDRLSVATEEAKTLRQDLEGGSLGRWFEDPALSDRLARLQGHVAALSEAAGRLGRYAEADGELRARVASLTRRADRLGAGIADLQRRIDEGDGVLSRMQRDSALAVALRRVQAQVDSLRAGGMDLALRMILP